MEEGTIENFSYPNRAIRRFKRKTSTKAIAYAVAHEFKKKKELNLNGKIVDICDEGIGIETDLPLMPGHMLWFNKVRGHDTGAVRWCTKLDVHYRVGIALEKQKHPLYRNDELEANVLVVKEETKEYKKVLEERTEEYIKQLEKLEQKCFLPYSNQEKLLVEFILINDMMLQTCAEFEKAAGDDKELIKSAQKEFYEKTNPILSKSKLVKHFRTWPHGFQGDYRALENIYKNTPLSKGIGYHIDKYSLSLPLTEAVRNRIQKLEELIREEIKNRKEPSILNIGCGSCRELMGLSPDIIDADARVVCIDNDNDALAFAQSRLSYTGALSNIEFRKYNALRMLYPELNLIEFGKKDIIYSVGLFDYLLSNSLTKMLKALYTLLNPGGVLVAAFKDADRYRSQDVHWIVNWHDFLHRDAEDFRNLLNETEIPDSAISELRDSTGIILFKIIRKHSDND